MTTITPPPASSALRKKTRRWLCCNALENPDVEMKEMQLITGIFISALQADYRMMVGYLQNPVAEEEIRAFSPDMLWTMPIVMLSKAFSLLSCIAVHQTRMPFPPQAESLPYHNLGHRPRQRDAKNNINTN